MILPEEIYIGITTLSIIYFVASFYVYSTSKNYVNAKLKSSISGNKFVFEVDDNRRLLFDSRKEDQGYLDGKGRRYMIVGGSALRSLDGLVFLVHKDIGRTLTSEFINSSSNLSRAGFRTFAHAAELYKQNYFKKDWEEAQAAISAKPAMASTIIDGVEKKIGIEIMKPIQEDNFTQDLSIVANFHKSKMSPNGFKNTLEKVRLEAERNHNDGFTAEKAMKYVIVLVALCVGVAFALILVNIAFPNFQLQPQKVVEVVSNVTNVTK